MRCKVATRLIPNQVQQKDLAFHFMKTPTNMTATISDNQGANPPLKEQRIAFSGQLLRRGFWLYAWRISRGPELYVYVGRTGDSSSPNAASPFSRMSQYLDFRANAKGNAMMRNLRKRGVEPVDCEFELHAIGPIFPEQDSMEQHKPFRDAAAALECALAKELRARGYDVLGNHSSRMRLDERIFKEVRNMVAGSFPALPKGSTGHPLTHA